MMAMTTRDMTTATGVFQEPESCDEDTGLAWPCAVVLGWTYGGRVVYTGGWYGVTGFLVVVVGSVS